MKGRPTRPELRAMAYRLADDILTRAAPDIARGVSRDVAISRAIAALAGVD